MESLPAEYSDRKTQLQQLSPKHKTVAALLAQGVGREDIAVAVEITPEYVTWLGGDPLFKQYISQMGKLAQTRLDAMFEQSVDVIAETMRNGGAEERLKAARLQMEATGRVGKDKRSDGEGDASDDHLEQLSRRLIQLMHKQREGVTYEAEVIPTP